MLLIPNFTLLSQTRLKMILMSCPDIWRLLKWEGLHSSSFSLWIVWGSQELHPNIIILAFLFLSVHFSFMYLSSNLILVHFLSIYKTKLLKFIFCTHHPSPFTIHSSITHEFLTPSLCYHILFFNNPFPLYSNYF